MLRFSLFLVLLSFLAAGAAAADSTVSIGWCSGTPQFRDVSGIEWRSAPVHSSSQVSSASSFAYSFCSSQSRVVSMINSARLRVKDEDIIFNICASRLDCLQRSLTRRPDGLYCLEGNVAWEFPVFASPARDTDVTVHLVDSKGGELATFCARY
jgi:hypothetical protein